LILGLFGEALETEEAGGVAFLDADLEVARGVEEGQFLAFPGIGVGFADAIDDFVPFKDDAEAAALAMFLEFFAGDIDDDVLEMIDEDDLAFDPVVAEEGAEVIFLQERWVGRPDIEEAAAIGELADGLGHDADAIEGVLDRGLVEGEADDHFGASFEDHGQQAIVGAKQVLLLVKGQEELFGLFLEQVHQDDMEGMGREVLDGIAADIGGLGVVEGQQFMGDIDEAECRVDL